MINWKKNLYIVWFAQILSLMSFGFGFPFMPYYIQELGITDPDRLKLMVGLTSMSTPVAMGIMAPIWGWFADKYGKKLMLARATFFGALVLIGIGFATNVTHIIILRFAQGLLTGTVTAALALVASNTPNERLSYALGVMSSSTFIGFSAGPAIGGILAESVGYRGSFFIGSGVMVFAFLIVLFLVKENKKILNSNKKNKERNRFSLKEISGIFSSNIIFMLFILFFMRIARTVIAPYMPLYVQEVRGSIEGSSSITGYVSALTALMTALSGIFLGRLGDKFNKISVIKMFFVPGIFLSIFLLFIDNNLLAFALILGLMFFAIGGIEPTVMSITSSNVPSQKRGILFGVQSMVGCIGWAAAPMIGSFISIHFSIKSIFIVTTVFLILALTTAITASKASENCKNVKIP